MPEEHSDFRAPPARTKVTYALKQQRLSRMSRPLIPLSVMFFPFLLSIQLAVCSLAKPFEDLNKGFDRFQVASDLIPDLSHGWTQTIPSFNRLNSQPEIVSQSQPDPRLLWASLNENSDGSQTAFTSAQGSPCRAGQDGIHRRDGELCTLDGKTGEAKDGAQEGAQEGAQNGPPEGTVQGAREEEGAQKEGTAPTEETPNISPVWTPPNIYDPNWRKELDEAMENMRIARERNNNLPWDDPTRCGDKWSLIPTTYSLHVCCDGVAVGAGIYLKVDNCDWRAFPPTPLKPSPIFSPSSLFSFLFHIRSLPRAELRKSVRPLL